MDSKLLLYSFYVCPLFLKHISHLLLYPYHLTEQWTLYSSSPHSRSVHYFSIIFPTFTIRVSSHRAMDSTLLQYSFQVCALFLKQISHLLLYPYHLTEQWTQHSSSTHSRSVHYFSIIFPTFTIPVSSHRAMDSTLLQYSFQVCPLFLNHISHFYYTRIISQSNGLNTPLVLIIGLSTISQSYFLLLLYPYHLTEQWTQHFSSTHSRSVHYFSIIFPTFTIRVSSHRAMDSKLLQYSFQVCPLFLKHISPYYYTRIISQSNGLNTPLVLILGLSTISQSYFPLLLYPYHLTEQWTQHSSSTHSRSVHYFSIIFPTFTIPVSSHRAMDSTLLQYSFLGLSTISQSYFPLITIPVSSHRAMDSTLLQYSFLGLSTISQSYFPLITIPVSSHRAMDSTLLQYSFQVCPLFLNHISHFYYTRIISQSNGLNTPLVLILVLSTISQSYFPLITIPVSSHRAMDSTLLQYSFQVCPLFLNHISHFYYTRIISQSNVFNTPLVLILGLSTISQSYFPLLLYAYHLTEQWTQRSSSTHSRSVHYFSIIFPTFTIRVSSHRAMDSTLLQYSFQVCPLFLNHISHLLLYPYHLTEQWTQHSSSTHSQVCPLFLNHISHLLLYPYHLTEQWTQHSSSTHSRSVHYFSIIFLTYYYTRIISQSNGLKTPLVLILGLSTISQTYFPLITIPVSSHRAMDSTLLQYSFQVCPLFLNHISHFYYTRIISQSNGLNTPLVLILGLSTISQSYFPLITIPVSSHRAMDSTLLQYSFLGLSTISQSYFPLITIPVSSHRAMDSTLLQYSFQVCPLFLNHISHLLLYPYHLTEQWTQNSSSTHSRSVHYFSNIFPTYYYTRIISQSNGLNTPLVLILGLSTISQSYFPLLLYAYHLTEQWTQHSSSTHSRSVHYFSIIFPTFTIRVSSHRAMDSTLLQYSFQVCPLFLNHISHFYYTRIISQSNGLNTPLVLILGLSTISQPYFPLLLYPYHLTEQWTQHSSSTHSRSVHYFLIIFPTYYYTRIISQSNGLNTPLVLILGLSTISQSYFPLITIPVSSHRAMDSTLLQYSFQVCPLFLNHISHFYYTRIISQSNGLNTPLVLILGLSTISQ